MGTESRGRAGSNAPTGRNPFEISEFLEVLQAVRDGDFAGVFAPEVAAASAVTGVISDPRKGA